MGKAKARPDWAKALAWAAAVVLAPIWLPLSAYHTIRDEIVAWRYLKRRGLR